MDLGFTLKNLIIAAAAATLLAIAFFVDALAGLNARPVVFAAPPAFVEQYVIEMVHSDSSSLLEGAETDGDHVEESVSAKLTEDFAEEEALVHKVFFDGESPDLILGLFIHPDKAQRVKIASAFSAVNVEFTHNEESGFPEKRDQFWLAAEEHETNIQNALFEALIMSAKEGTKNHIPYTLAWWMPVRDNERDEVLAWAAEHHSDPWVRWFSVMFVVEHGGNEELAVPLLRSRKNDPDYGVRKQVLDQRFRRLMGE